jgi:hypothetical protein
MSAPDLAGRLPRIEWRGPYRVEITDRMSRLLVESVARELFTRSRNPDVARPAPWSALTDEKRHGYRRLAAPLIARVLRTLADEYPHDGAGPCVHCTYRRRAAQLNVPTSGSSTKPPDAPRTGGGGRVGVAGSPATTAANPR